MVAKVKYLHTSCFTSIAPLDGNGRATLSLLGLEGGVGVLNRTRAVAVVFIVVGRAAVGAGARAGHCCGSTLEVGGWKMRALLAWTTGEMTGKMVVGMEMETKEKPGKKNMA